MSRAYDIISDQSLTYQQQIVALARLGESTDDTLTFNPEYLKAKEEGVLCDLNEGVMPFRPRYIIPDYRILMEKGSEFLNLPAPKNLSEALVYLQIMYTHVPSITTYPVYLGGFDELLEKFVLMEDYNSAKEKIRLFLTIIDRTLTDSFVHANLGPNESVTGKIVLELSMEMQLAIPNLTFKYDNDVVLSDGFKDLLMESMLKCAKPSFANHKMYMKDWGNDYAIASCYNGLKMAGGGYTLPRIKLYNASLKANDVDDFFNRVLPYYMDLQLEFMDQRIKFIVEDSSFFKSNFLATEGFVKQENFTGMFGMVGLAECVNKLLGLDKINGYGHNEEADKLGEKILAFMDEYVGKHEAKYCENCQNRYYLHAQVGIDSDNTSNSPGARIPVLFEPEMVDQLLHSCKMHKYFPTGIGDIFTFDQTWLKTPQALFDIVSGALNNSMRYFSGYLANNDLVRVTGYLVKKSEIEKLNNKKQSLNNVTLFGKGAGDTALAFNRKVQHESND
ncbi:MAG: YjjI family glycine radical enzyme [Erysipelotrichaceae bacterium]